MKRKSLGSLVSLVLTISSGHAAYLNLRGVGQVLIYPYYTVNANQSTMFTIVNTADKGKAPRICFHEGYNGRNVLSFSVYLSPYDVWSAALVQSGEGASIETTDHSCTVPMLNSASVPFRNVVYSG